MATVLNPGSLEKLKTAGSVQESVALKVLDLQENNGKLKCQLSDGKENMAGVITSQVARQFGVALKSNDIVRVTEGNVNTIEDKQILIVAGMELISEGDAPPADDQEMADASEPAAAAAAEDPVAAKPEEPAAPAASVVDAKTPAAAIKPTAGKTPASGPTPPSAGANTTGGKSTSGAARTVQPIASLNPYMHGWAIRAKVVSKGPKRSFSKSGQPASVFSAELVDEQGTTIEGTFWKEAADRAYDLLENDKVYIFARGSVKPANKKFSSTRNDYCLHFDAGVEIEACEGDNINASAMTARMEFVPIDQLAAFVDKKSTVDLVGVVTAVGAIGSTKRKSDSTEITRRDITLVDQGLKTVNVTLWGDSAEKEGTPLQNLLDAGQFPVVAISNCRVSSYNGISVSAVMRSKVFHESDSATIPEMLKLKEWYASSGHAQTTTAVGEGLATASKAQGPRERVDLSGVRAAAPPAPDAKPVYSTVSAAVAAINPDQSLYYLACPENNRKVTEQGPGAFYCEYDGKTYPSATRRYIMTARLTDGSGELPVQVFNDQAEALLGKSADDLHALRESAPATFKALLQEAAWTEWVLRVKAQAQEYNGEVRQRYAVAEISPIDFSTETRRTLDLIAGTA